MRVNKFNVNYLKSFKIVNSLRCDRTIVERDFARTENLVILVTLPRDEHHIARSRRTRCEADGTVR